MESKSTTHRRGRKFRFQVSGLLLLMLGFAIGFGMNADSPWFSWNPRENHMTTLPEYVIEPPDILDIGVRLTDGADPERGEEFASFIGEHLVGPDGRVNLGEHGSLSVTGKTLEQARRSLQESLKDDPDVEAVTVNLFSANSKKYYLIEQSVRGDQITAFPITGNETVLDAMAAGALGNLNSARIWVSRPSSGNSNYRLDVEWDDVAKGIDTRTNYQLFPGDRVFVTSTPARQP